jgi:hypothetical protein
MATDEKPAKARAPRRRKAAGAPAHDDIALRAYQLHLERPDAGELDNWLDAERELAAGS